MSTHIRRTQLKIKLHTILCRKSYTESYDNSYAESHMKSRTFLGFSSRGLPPLHPHCFASPFPMAPAKLDFFRGGTRRRTTQWRCPRSRQRRLRRKMTVSPLTTRPCNKKRATTRRDCLSPFPLMIQCILLRKLLKRVIGSTGQQLG
jgi:hypothetical protein